MSFSQPKREKQANIDQEFKHFQVDKNTCIFETSETYIFRSKPWCEKSNRILVDLPSF